MSCRLSRTLTLCVLVSLTASCAENLDSRDPAPPSPRLQRLFEQFDESWIRTSWDVAGLRADDAELLRDLHPSFQRTFEQATSDEALGDGAIYSARQAFAGAGPDPALPEPVRPSILHDSEIGFLHFERAVGALAWWIPIERDTAYHFHCRSRVKPRPDATEPENSGCDVLLFEFHAPLEDDPAVDRFELLRRAMPQSSAQHRIAGVTADGKWHRQAQTWRTSLYTRWLAIVLVAGDPGLRADPSTTPGAVDFDDVSLHALPLSRYLAVEDRTPTDDPLVRDPDRRSLSDFYLQPTKIAAELRTAVRLPPGSTLEMPLTLPKGRWRLQAGLGVVDESRSEWGVQPIETVIALDPGTGASRKRETWTPAIRPEDRGWHDFVFEGDETETTSAVLRLEVQGDGDGVVALSEPLLSRLDPAPPSRPPSVLLLSLDTLRRDHLGCYGARLADGSSPTPNIDRLAAESVVFEQSRSVAPYTLPTHASLLTGLYPRVHGVTDALRRLNPLCHPLLALDFADAGYHCAAFTGGGFVSFEYGFHHGFDRYSLIDPMLTVEDPLREQFPFPDSRELNDALHARGDLDAVLQWVDQREGEPFFLFVHSFLVHNYHPPERRRAEWWRPEYGSLLDQRERLHEIDLAAAAADRPHPDLLLQMLRDLYRATVREADARVGALLDGLRERGLWDNTIVVLTSDHGEEFGEHGGLLHGRTLYEEVLEIPLLVRVPGWEAARRGELVESVDVAPTLRAATGLPEQPKADGRDLTAASSETRMALAEVDARNLSRRRALVDETGRKWIENPDPSGEEPEFASRRPPRTELYDLRQDPREGSTLTLAGPPGLAEELARLLEELDRRHRERVPLEEMLQGRVSAAMVRQLEALGYVIPKGRSEPIGEGPPE